MKYSTWNSEDQAYIQSIDRSSLTYYPLFYSASKHIFENGNVGIGTTIPSQKLHVAGNIKCNDIDSTFVLIKRYPPDDIYGSAMIYVTSVGDNDMILHANSSVNDMGITFRTYGGVDRMRITKSGNVGIGNTSPSYKLDVTGDVNISSGSKYKINGADLNQSDIAGTLGIASGGTGATDAVAARIALGVDAAGTDNSTPVTLANTNYLTISGQEITGGTVPIASGGTGATTAAAARIALGVDEPGTDNSTPVTLANTNYLTISGQEITGGTVPIASGGTGATTSAGALDAILGHLSPDDGNVLTYSAITNTWAAGEGGGSSQFSSYWKPIINSTSSNIYYGANVKIGGTNTIDPEYALEITGNLRVTGEIISGWSGDGGNQSGHGDGGVTSLSGLWNLINGTDDIYYDGDSVITGTTITSNLLTSNIFGPNNDEIMNINNDDITLYKSIIPAVDNAIDLGSVNNKFREVFISNNSLWIGDKHKMAFKNGKITMKKRKTKYFPPSITTAGGNQTAALSYANVTKLEDMELGDWLGYMKTLPNKKDATISEVFTSNDDDYELEAVTDGFFSMPYNNTTSSNLIFNDAYTNFGIGNTNPQHKLDVDGDIYSSGNIYVNNNVGIGTTNPQNTLDVIGDIGLTGTLTAANLTVSGTTTTVSTATYQTENLEIVSTNADGPSLSISHNHSVSTYNIVEINKNSSRILTLANNGNVGIGNTTPNYKLDVNGDINTTTTVRTPKIDFSDGTSMNTASIPYTDADARSACFPLTQTNTGLPGTTSINLFENDIWFNSIEGRNRFYFLTDGITAIRAPDLTNSSIVLQIGQTDIFKSEISKNTSYKDLYIGNGSATTIPTLYLHGANGKTLSSRIVFADNDNTGSGYYKQGFAIFYDSTNNYLRIGGDDNFDSTIDTPYYFNIKRETGNVGIGINSPGYKLDVYGDIHTNTTVRTPQIDFDDGSSMTSAPFTPAFLKVYFLVDLEAIMTQSQEPGEIAPYFDQSNVPINIGGFFVTNSGISVPANGYYHIDYSLLMRSRFSGSDRKNIITYIRVNNSDPDGRLQAVAGSYMRFQANADNCENAQAGNTLLYLTTTDVVSLWGYREGSTGDVFITRAGNIQIKRIA